VSTLTRRGFLIGAGAGALGLSLYQLRRWTASPEAEQLPEESPQVVAQLPEYGNWQDLYRQHWTWDKVAKGTHAVNCWYQRGCNWNVYVKQGLVLREEQAATYRATNDEVPDFNPRGCQKGACYSQRMYDASRVRHPLKRAGRRGEGKWKRISWEDGLREIADLTVDVLAEDGPGAIALDPGTANTNGGNGMGAHRTGTVLDIPILNVNGEVGDHHPGALATCGKISFNSSADDLMYSDLILIWGGNPTFTQIPNAHFINEARYRGAKVVAIAPDYNASAIHADEWLPVEAGTDAALGLAMAQVIVEEGLYDAPFLLEQTDFPLLVRTDTQRFLRKADLEEGGAEDRFYVFDKRSGTIREADTKSLAIEGFEPELTGEYEVDTRAGRVKVETVFERLRKQLAGSTPEATEPLTGAKASRVRALARRIARSRAATFISQASFSKYYHGLEMERVQILVFTLCGQIGKKGSGISGFPALTVAGIATSIVSSGELSPRLGGLLLAAQSAPAFIKHKLAGLTDEMVLYELVRDEYRLGGHISGVLFQYFHGGLEKQYGASAEWDPSMKRPLASYLDEAIQKGWQVAPPKQHQRIFFACGGNTFRRSRGGNQLIDHFLPKLDLMVTLEWRMSHTAQHSDYVFPAAGWYERDDITWATPLAPFVHVTTRAVEPLAEAKSDWEFHCLFLKEVQKRATARGIHGFRDRMGRERRLDQVYDMFTFSGRFTEENEEALVEELISMTTNLNGISWSELKKKGFERYSKLGSDFINIGNATDLDPHQTITANTWHTEDKLPWPTLTRRIQFYIDHPFYLELGEELPVHKASPTVGGDYPLQLVCQHPRWSIHASWRDEDNLLRLQRGEPIIMLDRSDAAARNLGDGDRARVRNDAGAFEVQVKISGSVRPGQVIVDHAWEPCQFKGGNSFQTVTVSPMNPIQLAGGYFHLQPTPITGEPGPADRDTRVEVERV
jgi:DMSO reductase family type II enzyme molybdopterin subunit